MSSSSSIIINSTTNSNKNNNNEKSNKKAKKQKSCSSSSSSSSSVEADISKLREYILKCPTVASDSTAVRVAITALDSEWKKMQRDEKLRRKFAMVQTTVTDTDTATGTDTANVTDDHELDDEEEYDTLASHLASTNTTTSTCNTSHQEDAALLMEWQDVNESSTEDHTALPNDSHNDTASSIINNNHGTTSSLLGKALAKTAVTEMSNANVLITTPIAALGAALHSALRSHLLNFCCTGIPDDPTRKKKGGGFAAPVRELPKHLFLPKLWDAHASLQGANTHTSPTVHSVALRYRKEGIGSVILSIRTTEPMSMPTTTSSPSQSQSQSQSQTVEITFGPAGREPTHTHTFPLQTHVNLHSLSAALAKTGNKGVPPALHYKALSILMTEFAQRFDLGMVHDVTDAISPSNDLVTNKRDVNATATANANVNATASQEEQEGRNCKRVEGECTVPEAYRTEPGTTQPTRIRVANPNPVISGMVPLSGAGGDFAEDLLPTGIPLPGFANPRGGIPFHDDGGNLGGVGGGGGMLMGPNHSTFQRIIHDSVEPDELGLDGGGGGGGRFPNVGGLGMQPRFDPYYPPGVGTGNGGGIPMPGRGGGRDAGRGAGGRGRGGRRPHRSLGGDPNPDHQRPPNNLGGGNMFM